MISLEIAFIFIYAQDILFNLRTTFSNDQNEEIIDPKQTKNHYINSTLFWIDIIGIIPLGEILLTTGAKFRHNHYSYAKLFLVLRLFKLGNYMENVFFGWMAKILSIFLSFLMGVIIQFR